MKTEDGRPFGICPTAGGGLCWPAFVGLHCTRAYTRAGLPFTQLPSKLDVLKSYLFELQKVSETDRDGTVINKIIIEVAINVKYIWNFASIPTYLLAFIRTSSVRNEIILKFGFKFTFSFVKPFIFSHFNEFAIPFMQFYVHN